MKRLLSRKTLTIFCVLSLGIIRAPHAAAGSYYNNVISADQGAYCWIPDSVKIFRAVIVKMHGGGRKGDGPQVPNDLWWQALARKWDAILVGAMDGDCPYQAWTDGSGQMILATEDSLARRLGHPEIKKLPWCVWGHSCGGNWEGKFIVGMPGRTIAGFARSGMNGDEANNPEVLKIPIWGDCSIQDLDKSPTTVIPNGRLKGAPWTLTVNPNAGDGGGGHACGNSRYLAIPFFDMAMRQRLPTPKLTADSVILNPVDSVSNWYGSNTSPFEVGPKGSFSGTVNKASWIFNQSLASKFVEYNKTDEVKDSTPPSAPYSVTDSLSGSQAIIKWQADADIESGVHSFYIYRNGSKIGQLDINQWGYGDESSYSSPVQLRFVDSNSPKNSTYSVSQVNWAGLESAKTGVGVNAIKLYPKLFSHQMSGSVNLFDLKGKRVLSAKNKNGIFIIKD